jgi:hypothetical protein
VGINIGPRVLGFSGLKENIGNKLVNLTDKLEQRVVGQVLESEFTLGSVPRILKNKKMTKLIT